ncbi:MAG TPA: sensor histidine kinase [Haliangiales bacterium]|nr:sensor histidine kinase [Haliangiales bacterium]
MAIARTMQWVGYALYAIAGLEPVIDSRHSASPAWIVAYAVFGLAFHVGASAPADVSGRRRRAIALLVTTAAMLVMAALRPCTYGALTLVVVASQAALIVPPRAAAAWVVAQTAVVSACLVPNFGWLLGLAEIIALVGFQGFAVAAIVAARREAQARAALAAAQCLLEEATRAEERTRIARDLHDVLGHDLTALGLQLEIASHVDDEAARARTVKARELTSRLLRDVRAVVAALRPDRLPGLAAAIRAMLVDVPGLAIHLDAPETLGVDEPERADCIVRCAQEIVTNARRHAVEAENLWIRIRRDGGAIVVEAHDDGKGAYDVKGGHGLRGMRSRLEELGGRLEVRAEPGRPFAVTAWLPVRGQP